MRDINGVLYCNDGDWVESLTALVEHHDGRLEIADWSALRDRATATLPAPAGREAAAPDELPGMPSPAWFEPTRR